MSGASFHGYLKVTCMSCTELLSFSCLPPLVCSADSPLLWIRIDPDMSILRKVEFEQADFMWQYQLRYERDVVAQVGWWPECFCPRWPSVFKTFFRICVCQALLLRLPFPLISPWKYERLSLTELGWDLIYSVHTILFTLLQALNA